MEELLFVVRWSQQCADPGSFSAQSKSILCNLSCVRIWLLSIKADTPRKLAPRGFERRSKRAFLRFERHKSPREPQIIAWRGHVQDLMSLSQR